MGGCTSNSSSVGVRLIGNEPAIFSDELESSLLYLRGMTANNGQFSWRSLVATGVIILIFAGLIVLTRKSKAHARANAQDVAASLEHPYGFADRTAAPPTQTQSRPTSTWSVRHWSLPHSLTGKQGDRRVVDLVVNDSGTVVLAKTEKEAYCFDLTSGLVLQTYRPAPSKFDRDSNAERIFLSPKGKYVATWAGAESAQKPDATITFQEAESGRVVSVATLEHDAHIDFDPAIFTPQENTLLLPGNFHGRQCIQAVSVATGTHKFINLPTKDGGMKMLLPLAGQARFLACWSNDRSPDKHPSRVSILDLQSWTERMVSSIDIEPSYSFYERRAAVSPEGKMLLVADTLQRGEAHFELTDLRFDQQVIQHTETRRLFGRPLFTPDRQRFIVESYPNYQIMHFSHPSNQPGIETPPSKLQLYDIAKQKMISEYSFYSRPAATLAISGDGKKIVYSYELDLCEMDFRNAFNMEPLPPMLGLEEPVLTSR
jgi:hypothetical protein